MSRSANNEPKTKTLSRVSFMAKRSSKVSSLRTTSLYLCNSFLVSFFLRDFSDVFEYFIETKLNKQVSASITGTPYNNFRCKYNAISNTFWFGNLKDKFVLKFGDKLEYTYDCTQLLVWNNYKKWGLPAYLGYKKRNYSSTLTPGNIWYTNTQGDPFGFDYEMEDGSGNEWLTDVSNNRIINLYD